MYLFRALGIDVEAIFGAGQFKLQTPQATSHALGPECPTAIGMPNGHWNCPQGGPTTSSRTGVRDPVSHVRARAPSGTPTGMIERPQSQPLRGPQHYIEAGLIQSYL
eukprot:5686184-Alexandrium_andersonii.AAC.1